MLMSFLILLKSLCILTKKIILMWHFKMILLKISRFFYGKKKGFIGPIAMLWERNILETTKKQLLVVLEQKEMKKLQINYFRAWKGLSDSFSSKTDFNRLTYRSLILDPSFGSFYQKSLCLFQDTAQWTTTKYVFFVVTCRVHNWKFV